MNPQRPERQSPALDWDRVRQSLGRRLRGQLDPAEIHELDDLVQEGCVRLLRVARREPIGDPEAMITVIARRTFRDWLRRRYRHERMWRPLRGSDDSPAPEGPDPRYGDLIDRIEFVVMQIFRREGREDCAELARGWFGNRNWKQIADELGLGHASVRKRWSRCLELPRRLLGADPDLETIMRKVDHD